MSNPAYFIKYQGASSGFSAWYTSSLATEPHPQTLTCYSVALTGLERKRALPWCVKCGEIFKMCGPHPWVFPNRTGKIYGAFLMPEVPFQAPSHRDSNSHSTKIQWLLLHTLEARDHKTEILTRACLIPNSISFLLFPQAATGTSAVPTLPGYPPIRCCRVAADQESDTWYVCSEGASQTENQCEWEHGFHSCWWIHTLVRHIKCPEIVVTWPHSECLDTQL